MFMELMSKIFIDHWSSMIHILNLFVLLTLIILFVIARKTRKRWTRINDYIGVVASTINSVRYGDLSKKVEQLELLDSEELSESINKMIETLSDREKMIDEYLIELNKQNRLLEAVINSLSDGLVIIDGNYNILRATTKISEWFEISGNKLPGSHILDFIQLPERKNIENLKDTDIVLNSDRASNFIASTIELKLEDKKKRFIIIIKNVTDQRELENLKEDFIATLTHDLKVPIIAETNMLDLFLNESFGRVSEKQKFALKNMQASNRELLDLVQIVLDTYKYRGHNIRLQRENIMLKSFIGDIILDMTPIADKSNNIIKFVPSRDIRVFADKIQLKRVIKNLIQNAISYGEANSPIEISIGEIPNYITIKVKDFGEGISEEDVNKIFNKYYSAAKKFRKIGTGLGLYLSLQIMKAHNGDLTVESKEGEFTEFCVKIPAASDTTLLYGE